MTGWALALAGVLLLTNGFFVGVEFALIASRRSKLETLAGEGRMTARLALQATRELGLQLAGAQLGITMASLGLGAVAEPALAGLIESALETIGHPPAGLVHGLGFALALTIVVFLHMVIGEMVPKNMALADPERAMLALAIPARAYVAVFSPLIRLLNGLANAGTRLFGVEPRDELATIHTARELSGMLAVSRQEGLVDDLAHDLLSGALVFGERRVGEAMVPLSTAVTVPRTITVSAAEELVVESGHSRLLIEGGRPGEIVGFVHAKDLLTVSTSARDRPLPLARIRRVLVLDYDTPLDDTLVAMRRSRTHVAVVIQDAAATGLVTLEDVIELLVGDITDESDTDVS
jgi:CBS domain containing-hemolysin-like protein